MEDAGDTTDPKVRIVEAARRDFEKKRGLPADLLSRWAEAGSDAAAAWRVARANSDWATFAPLMSRMVDLNRQIADTVGYEEHPMDCLLSMYETGPTAAEIGGLLDALRDFVVPLTRTVEWQAHDWEKSAGSVSVEEVEQFLRSLAESVGYDFSRGRIDTVAHPRTFPAGPEDVRLTLHAGKRPIASHLSSCLHESGHAIYEQGIDEAFWDSPCARGIMPYVHESQSKFWENAVGDTAEFQERVVVPLVEKHLSSKLDANSVLEMLRDYRMRGPSLIRIESDELSFNLHIILRWEIECQLLSGELSVWDVPEAWNEKAQSYLGLSVPNDGVGCLQDPHWTHRYFGLFTGYVIGNIVMGQLKEAMEQDGIVVSERIGTKDHGDILAWLRRNVHAPGRSVSLDELLRAATGSGLRIEPYINYLSQKFGTAA